MTSGEDPVDIPPQYSAIGMNNLVPVINHTAVQQINDGKYAQTYRKSASLWIGSILIMCGAVSISGGVMAVAFFSPYAMVGNGIWVGAIFVTAGSLAIAAACHPTTRLVYAATAFAFISLGFGVFQMILSLVSVTSRWYNPYCYYYYCYTPNWEPGADTADGLMVASAIVAGIVGLCLGIINCKTINICCCDDSANQDHVASVPVQYAPVPSGQYTGQPQIMTQVPTGQFNGQPVYYYMNPNQQNQQPLHQLSALGIQAQPFPQVMPQPMIITQYPTLNANITPSAQPANQQTESIYELAIN